MASAYEQLVQRIRVGHPEDTAAEMIRLLDCAIQDDQLTNEEEIRSRTLAEVRRAFKDKRGDDGSSITVLGMNSVLTTIDALAAVNMDGK